MSLSVMILPTFFFLSLCLILSFNFPLFLNRCLAEISAVLVSVYLQLKCLLEKLYWGTDISKQNDLNVVDIKRKYSRDTVQYCPHFVRLSARENMYANISQYLIAVVFEMIS